MKQMLHKFLYILLPSNFRHSEISLGSCINAFILQKLLRINSHVPWPVHPTSKIIAPEKIERGTRFPGLSAGCHIDGRNGIKFGKNVWVGPAAKIISMNHDMHDYHQYEIDNSIEIGDNCWIGANAIILPEVQIGEHVVIGAGSVVTKDMPSDSLVAGVPATVKRRLSPYNGKSPKGKG